MVTAGAYLCQSPITFERYLQEYKKRWNIDPKRPIPLLEYQNRTLFTTWDISYSRLEGHDPDAAKLLKLLAYFDHQSIWYELLQGGLTSESSEWMHEVIANDIDFIGVMRTLTDYCFLDLQTDLKTWSMHACVHDWAVAELNKVINTEQYWYTFDCVAASIGKDGWDSLDQLSYSRRVAHAERLVHDRFHANDLTHDIGFDRLDAASWIAQLLTKQVQLAKAERMYLRVLAGKEKALGPDHTSTLDTVNNLGTLYHDQGKLEKAEQIYLRALAGKEKALGPDHTLEEALGL